MPTIQRLAGIMKNKESKGGLTFSRSGLNLLNVTAAKMQSVRTVNKGKCAVHPISWTRS